MIKSRHFNPSLKTLLSLSFSGLIFIGLTACSEADAPNNPATENTSNEQHEARGVKEAPLPSGPKLNQNSL